MPKMPKNPKRRKEKKVTGYVEKRSKKYQATSLHMYLDYQVKPKTQFSFPTRELNIERFAGVL